MIFVILHPGVVVEDGILSVIEYLYAASLDAALWPLALTRLADSLGGVDTTLEVHKGPGTVPRFFACGCRLPDDGVANYLAHYSKVCPRIPFINSQRPGSVGVDYDFTDERQMDASEFYADFLAPDDLRYFISGCLGNRPGEAVSFAAVHRSPGQGHAGPGDMKRLEQLIPHIRQALDTHLRLDGLEQREAALLDSFEAVADGVILLDASGHPVHASGRAITMLAHNDGLALGSGGLEVASPTARREFQAILAGFLAGGGGVSVMPGGEVFVPRPSGHRPYALLVRRLPSILPFDGAPPSAVAIVFIQDYARQPLPAAERLISAFGLTRREADLALALLKGQSLRDHADERGIQLTTARYHLYQAMAKMDVRRQTDMIRLLSRLSSPTN